MSASAFKCASGCLKRFDAEYVKGGRTPGTSAADLGSTVHLALEKYVQATVIEKVQPQELNVLLSCYMMAYLETMSDYDLQSDVFKDGEQMVRKWHARNNFDGIEVLSCEVKDHFELPYTLPDGTARKMRVNYICDRVDRIGGTVECQCSSPCPEEVRVVDYKTWRNQLAPDEVKGEIQPKIYSLAYRIRFPHAKRIWVILDQLRGEEVGACFTRDDDILTFRTFKAKLQSIIDTPVEKARETINDECGWCVRKAACKALRKHDAVGGELDMSLDQLIALHYEIKSANKARNDLLESVEKLINGHMDDIGLTNLETLDGEFELNTGGVRGGRRHVKPDLFAAIVGPQIATELADYGIKKIDALEHDPRVTPEQWAAIENAMWTSPGRRQVVVKRKKKKEEE
ncbi:MULTISPECIES: PD-(D/E)XK nuclease family protein [Streptomyces]|uniref:PD-(D/E)XK nuclease family protein n=1 Tax=Streptomyces TaxID=1883 RepID=UPI003648C697